MPNGVQQCEAGINSNLANIEAQKQSQWCWAACISMVFGYYGHPVDQERIVKETWGDVVNLPGQPEQIIHDLNRAWEDDNGRSFKVSGNMFTANAMTAAQDLAADHPLIIGTGGHAVVLTAERYLRDGMGRGQVLSATVRDPWPGRGRRPLSSQEWYGINFAVRIVVKSVQGNSSVQHRDTSPPRSTPRSDSMDFCTAFNRLIGGVPTDFISLKGNRRPYEVGDIYDEWDSKVSLPNASDCKIQKYRSKSTFQCRCLLVRTTDASDATKVFDDVLMDAKRCLGPKRKFYSEDTDGMDTWSTSKDGVAVEIHHLHKDGKHSVSVVFEKPDF